MSDSHIEKRSPAPHGGVPLRKSFRATGHLVDSGIFKEILDTIIREEGEFRITRFDIGKTNEAESVLEAVYSARTTDHLERITHALTDLGAEVDAELSVRVEPAPADGVAPRDFYTTTNHETTVNRNGETVRVEHIRMDGAIVISESDGVTRARCVKQRDLKHGDHVVVGYQGIKVEPEFVERDRSEFGFMTGDVSSERIVRIVVDRVAEIMSNRKKKIVVVGGPVLVHTGGSQAFCRLVEHGFVHAVLSGNALAVHDIENQLFGTSLGINTVTGEPVDGGHSHHLRAINEVRRAGSIKALVEEGTLASGVMCALVRTDVPFALAGSIRDDGPLPETITDMNAAQEAYAKLLQGADVCLMLASMLHSIAAGNMLPARTLTVCVDINPPVVTKLKDRGSHQAIGVVTDVGLFLHLLADRLCSEK
ncbi:MAG TPA: TIGR00300 family protein [candidate division Zixibacteria bacterium]|nr:TIGR00300 family protein [candidate division Zixibacteria bacterium]